LRKSQIQTPTAGCCGTGVGAARQHNVGGDAAEDRCAPPISLSLARSCSHALSPSLFLSLSLYVSRSVSDTHTHTYIHTHTHTPLPLSFFLFLSLSCSVSHTHTQTRTDIPLSLSPSLVLSISFSFSLYPPPPPHKTLFLFLFRSPLAPPTCPRWLVNGVWRVWGCGIRIGPACRSCLPLPGFLVWG
jgi:hypothetical protein